jgi:hypothetical protein
MYDTPLPPFPEESLDVVENKMIVKKQRRLLHDVYDNKTLI